MKEIYEENISSMCRLCLNDKAKRLISLTDDEAHLHYKIQAMADIIVSSPCIFLIKFTVK